ncbi:MAG: cache domain-containing protein [Spirochaetota bacterium]
MRRKPAFLPRRSLRFILIAAMVGPMLLAVTAVGTFSYTQGRAAMRSSIELLFEQVNGRVSDHISDFLSIARTINDFNVESFASGHLRITDGAAIEGDLIAVMRSHPSISSTYVGSSDGGLLDAGREGPGGREYVIETPSFAAGPFVKSAIDKEGAKTSNILSLPNFDARSRPWFREAVAKGGSTWTEIFSLFSGQDSAISAASPIHDREGRFVGVVSVDLFLSQIGAFLATLHPESQGRSFIVDSEGFLVASSADSRIFTEVPSGQTPVRIRGDMSVDPLTSAAAGHIAELRPRSSPIVQDSFTLDGKRFIALISPLPEPAILGWRIVSVFPERAFTERLDSGLRDSILLALGATALFAAFGVILASFMASYARQLSSFAGSVAEGSKRREMRFLEPSSIVEVEELRQDLLVMEKRLDEGFTRLRDEIEERKDSEARLRKSEHAYDRLARNIPVGVYVLRTSVEGNFAFEYVSPRFLDIFGLPEGFPITGPESYMDLIHPGDRKAFLTEQGSALVGTRSFAFEGRILLGDKERWIRMESIPEVQENGDVLWDGVLADTTEARLADRRIATLLAEKELLLREVHHRIKNNMNTVAAMLAFQADLADDAHIAEVLRESQDRLMSMMILYDKLYRSDDVSSADAASYLADIADHVALQFAHRSEVSLEKRLETLSMDAQRLMPLGIIANELLTNAYKHAFPKGRPGTIRIGLEVVDGRARFSIEDDGIGAHPGQGKAGFGKTLIDGLSKQIGTSILEGGGPGTRFEIVIPL